MVAAVAIHHVEILSQSVCTQIHRRESGWQAKRRTGGRRQDSAAPDLISVYLGCDRIRNEQICSCRIRDHVVLSHASNESIQKRRGIRTSADRCQASTRADRPCEQLLSASESCIQILRLSYHHAHTTLVYRNSRWSVCSDRSKGSRR